MVEAADSFIKIATTLMAVKGGIARRSQSGPFRSVVGGAVRTLDGRGSLIICKHCAFQFWLFILGEVHQTARPYHISPGLANPYLIPAGTCLVDPISNKVI